MAPCRRAMAAGAVLAAVVAGACGTGTGATPGPDGSSPARLSVVTSVAPITSIVSSVVGDRARVTGVVPEGTNSHTFEPKPSVAEVLATADVVYLNGLMLEEPTRELADDTIDDDAEVVELGAAAIEPRDHIYDFSFPRSGGKPNPHLWTDPTLARRYAEVVRDDMSERDPRNAAAYAEGCARFVAKVDELDAAMRTASATVPERTLLTYHDAYAYFARTYGWKVIGAIQVSDFEDPTPAEVARLIDQVRSTQVRAIFGSEVFPSPVLEQIGKETGVAYVDTLRDDDLPGSPGEPRHSWLGLMREDFITMTSALGGDASALEAVRLGPAPVDTAVYPQ